VDLRPLAAVVMALTLVWPGRVEPEGNDDLTEEERRRWRRDPCPHSAQDLRVLGLNRIVE